MFMLNMPVDFKVGETRDCRINGKPARVTWRDQHTLVIEPDDARQIFSAETDGKLRCFMCGDPGAKQAGIWRGPDGVVVSQDDADRPDKDDNERANWTSELARSIVQLIIERSLDDPLDKGRAAVDTGACVVALKHVIAVLIASQPQEEWKRHCENFARTLPAMVAEAAANPTSPLH
jgi:hypothetical protein